MQWECFCCSEVAWSIAGCSEASHEDARIGKTTAISKRNVRLIDRFSRQVRFPLPRRVAHGETKMEDLLVKHFAALVNLLFGAAFAIAAVLVLLMYRSIFGITLALSIGAVFATLGWLALQGLISEAWVRVSALAGATCSVFMIQRIFRISSGTNIDSTRCCQ